MIYKPNNRRPMFNDDSILPLINIIFLLMIFFMVLGRIYPSAIKKADLIKLPASKNFDKKNLTIYMDEKGMLLKDDKPIIIKNINYKKNQKISLVVNKNTPANIFVKSLNSFKKIGAEKISIVVKKKTTR